MESKSIINKSREDLEKENSQLKKGDKWLSIGLLIVTLYAVILTIVLLCL